MGVDPGGEVVVVICCRWGWDGEEVLGMTLPTGGEGLKGGGTRGWRRYIT